MLRSLICRYRIFQSGKNEKKTKPEGYEDQILLYKKITASEFIRSKNYLEILGSVNQVNFDSFYFFQQLYFLMPYILELFVAYIQFLS